MRLTARPRGAALRAPERPGKRGEPKLGAAKRQ